jgi:hypothetical protein
MDRQRLKTGEKNSGDAIMINKNNHSISKQHSLWTALVLAFVFLLARPDSAQAQPWVEHGNNINNTNPGNVGIGAASPNTRLSINPSMTEPKITLWDGGSATSHFGFGISNNQLNYHVISGTSHVFYQGGKNGDGNVVMIINGSGNVGIGTANPSTKLHVDGNVTVTGNIAAKYQDVAEWVPARRSMPAGTVVVLDTEQSNKVLASFQAYDTRVAGVISASPGVILGEAGDGKLMVATTGRVKVKVDATRGPIHVGDLLVTSDKEGIAMRSEPLRLGGTPIHRPGTLIGKALEPLEKGVGEILVLLSLQ